MKLRQHSLGLRRIGVEGTLAGPFGAWRSNPDWLQKHVLTVALHIQEQGGGSLLLVASPQDMAPLLAVSPAPNAGAVAGEPGQAYHGSLSHVCCPGPDCARLDDCAIAAIAGKLKSNRFS